MFYEVVYVYVSVFLGKLLHSFASDLKIISARLYTGSPSDDFFLTGSSAAKFVENNVENKENKERKKEMETKSNKQKWRK